LYYIFENLLVFQKATSGNKVIGTETRRK